ncbi:bifunctional aspartate kinase/homoserine dehydrogenase I [Persicobacter psychrovividus]|uniref:Bifunctional aspartate kinase/homoserine dehydrogenase I n=1 Tax=Persicobacter psychrovividus TaxID=387638 RepID=A0ABM7VA25_9BACT|nr:bifunctional aspartate kinase/homoserine dehydrogenase I [Persicobacter psychrovividus]
MKVLKFGGTSVGSAESLAQVVGILKDNQEKGTPVAVVNSALSGITNLLVEAGQLASAGDEQYKTVLSTIERRHIQMIEETMATATQAQVLEKIGAYLQQLRDILHGVFLIRELSKRTGDVVLSFGERMASYLLSTYANQHGLATEVLDARKIIVTDANFGNARVFFDKTNKNIVNHFASSSKIQIITGFIAATEEGVTSTLGRGGSDYTAAIFGSALNAEKIEIWTDVDGVMTTDPRQVKKTYSLASLSYAEAMEMSHFGAKVIYPPTIAPAMIKNIPISIRNTFNPEFEGTLISSQSSNWDFDVKGISSISEVSLVNFQGSGIMGVPNVPYRLFNALSEAEINVIFITQASSERSISFAISPEDAQRTKQVLEAEFSPELSLHKVDAIEIRHDLSVVATIGENMRHQPGVAAKLFGALGRNGINVVSIAQGTSELNISVVVEKKDLGKTLNCLHDIYFLSDETRLNIFIAGVGLIGSTLLAQMKAQYENLLKEHLKINIVGIANSKQFYFDSEGIDLDNWKALLLEKGTKGNIDGFVDQMVDLNLSNAVFVDNTSSQLVVENYQRILNNSISITTPNKLASSGDFMKLQEIKQTAMRRGVKFFYETSVGAGLPVITTLNDLLNSGDKIQRIEGVLSGTLSYIFNSFKVGTSFSEIVKQAQAAGFTEPDPRDDLNGMDVRRKILILSREAGYQMDISDVAIEGILPDSCMQAPTVDDFFTELGKHDHHFENILKEAEADGKVLRFIACMEKGKATVSLKAVGPEHPFFSLSGSDNIISFTTSRYLERPLVVKGPGAGAEVTAAGVFAEVIRIFNHLS